MKVHLSNKITIEGAPESLKNQIKEALSLPNPAYHKAIRANPRLQYNPQFRPFVEYFEEENGKLIIPRGCRDRLLNFLKQVEIIEDYIDVPAKIGPSTIKLRDYQRGVVEQVLKKDQGIIQLSTGWGKTILCLKLIETIQQKSLIIVPRVDLLDQFYEEYRRYFGEEPGRVRGSQCNIKACTVATVQSLKLHIDRGTISREEFGLLLIDECHTFISPKRMRILSYFRSRYFYGLTATAKRSDGQGEAIGFYFGSILINKKLPQKHPKIEIIEYDGWLPVMQYADMVGHQTTDEERNDKVAQVVKDKVSKGHKVLVLTKRVRHYEDISSRLGGVLKVFPLSSKTKAKDRKDLMAGLRENKIDYDVLLGTFSLLSTGIDIPSLDCLVIAGDLKSDVLLEQSGGRILRLFDGKKDPVIVDIVDKGNKILLSQARGRIKSYKELGWI